MAKDNPINWKVVEFSLKKLGHRVTSVTEGKAALDRVQERDIDLA